MTEWLAMTLAGGGGSSPQALAAAPHPTMSGACAHRPASSESAEPQLRRAWAE